MPRHRALHRQTVHHAHWFHRRDPLSAGAAALVLSVKAGLSWVQVREILATSPLLTNHSLLARQRDARTHRTRCYHHLHDCSGGGNSSLVERIVGE
jgi:hypothetical protein